MFHSQPLWCTRLEAGVTVLIQPAGDDGVCVAVQTWNLAPMAVEIRSACKTGLGKRNLHMQQAPCEN